MVHLAYCDAKAKELDRLIKKEKSMLIRGAAGRKLPHGRVQVGDIVYLIENNGDCLIKAKAIVSNVDEYVKISPEESAEQIQKRDSSLQLSDAQKKRWTGKKCLSFFDLKDIEIIEPPLPFDHQSNMDDWLIVDKIEDVVVGTSIDFNYHKIKLK